MIWRWTGYNALIYLGAMQAIPKELFEAAAIDRAGTWRQLWYITLPALSVCSAEGSSAGSWKVR